MVKQSTIKFPLIVYILLISPLLTIMYFNGAVFDIYQSILGTLGVSLFILLIYLLLKNISIFIAKIITLSLLGFFLVIRLVLSFVYDFSGRGFTSEFFAHIGWQSFAIGLDEYLYSILMAVVLCLALIVFLVKILNTQKQLKIVNTVFICILSAVLIIANKNSVPEWKLLEAYNVYNLPVIEDSNALTTRIETSAILEPIRGTKNLPVEKSKISIEAIKKEKNIVIIYLESFSDILTENPDYPNLTPNLDKLKSEHISFKNNFSSAYVTIEGLANSQCGTLMNMDSGNNSLTSVAGRLPNLPCLGDVLQHIGYKQIYYGGADLAFAGKGAFFSTHGYDEVWGINKWKEKGLISENIWGLTDSTLFDQALLRILELNKEEQSFNLTLLTLGTHIPGFIYEGCTKYTETKHRDSFIDAIHCTDYLVGKFVQQLKKHNILDNTVVYIQGDHPIFPTHDMRELFGKKTQD